MRSVTRRLLVFAALLIAIIGIALYGIAAYVVYDEVSRTTDPNPGRFADVTPANLRFSDAGVTFDFSRFETPDYSDVVSPAGIPRLRSLDGSCPAMTVRRPWSCHTACAPRATTPQHSCRLECFIRAGSRSS